LRQGDATLPKHLEGLARMLRALSIVPLGKRILRRKSGSSLRKRSYMLEFSSAFSLPIAEKRPLPLSLLRYSDAAAA